MFKKIKTVIKEIAKSLAISLFFSSFLVMIVYAFFQDDLSRIVFLFNQIIVAENQGEEKEIHFDTVKKKLVNYPNYGQVWATLEIPKVNVEAIVYHGDSLDLLKKGVGHYSGSYFSGEGGTVLLAGHNSKEHFQGLPQLVTGDEIIVRAQYGTYTYQVFDSKVMKASELEKISIQREKEILVLYTCYPVDAYGYKSKRYVVYAELVGEKYET